MGKNKKRKTSSSSGNVPKDGPNNEDTVNRKNNPLYREQQLFLSSLTPKERDFYFSSLSSNSTTPERRAEIWMEQAEIGEGLVNSYAWSTPTNECLQIFREFSPIVEIGCGSNAYWAKYIKQTAGIDIVAYDMNVQEGGKILSKATTTAGANEKKKKHKTKSSSNFVMRKGGSEVLKLQELRNHTLFLCYPDEEDAPIPDDDDDDDDEQESSQPLSFGWQCLSEYKGTYVIHVGELAVLGDATLNMEQSPWGRSSSSEFQQRLASEFHCIAKLPLPNWLHVRDSISVWKRSEICQMVFAADSDEEDDEDEIIEYRHIPPGEMLPRRVIAPCMEHVFEPPSLVLAKKETPTAKSRSGIKANEKKTNQKTISTEEETSTCSTKSKTEVGAKTDLDNEKIDDENETEKEKEMQRKKTKRGARRERQKQKKMLSMQSSSCNNGEDLN